MGVDSEFLLEERFCVDMCIVDVAKGGGVGDVEGEVKVGLVGGFCMVDSEFEAVARKVEVGEGGGESEGGWVGGGGHFGCYLCRFY